MAELTTELLNELERLEREASKAPWVEDDGNVFSQPQVDLGYAERSARRTRGLAAAPGSDSDGSWDGLVAKCEQSLPNFEADAEFITQARNNLPALIAAARRLLDLESALEFLEGGFRPVRSLLADDILGQAKECGWKPPGDQNQ